MRRFRITRLNLVTHLAALLPLLVLIWDFQHGNLTVNPIQAAEQRTGKIAITLLVLTLACTPANTLTGFRKTIHLRRPLGLWAFFYALMHFAIFSALDYGLDWGLLRGAIFEKPYIIIGLSALLILTALAATSWGWWKKTLGKLWKRLHQLVYLASLLVLLHFAWAVKGDLFRLRGNILQPLLYTLIVVMLLVMRFPPVRRWIVRTRYRMDIAGKVRALSARFTKPADDPQQKLVKRNSD